MEVKKNKLYYGSGVWDNKDTPWYDHDFKGLLWYTRIWEKSRRRYEQAQNVEDKLKRDFDFDLTQKKKFPLDDSSLQAIYTSHLIEHLSNDCVDFIFKDSYRLLKEGGVFRIVCPDIEKTWLAMFGKNEKSNEIRTEMNELMNEYVKVESVYEQFMYFSFSYFCKSYKIRDVEWLVDEDIYKEYLALPKVSEDVFLLLLKEYGKYGVLEYFRKKSEEYLDHFKYHLSGLHVNWWNEQKVIFFLMNAGFEKIYIKEKNSSNDKDMCDSKRFDYSIPNLSLFIEAVK